jgi:hypothetical protein
MAVPPIPIPTPSHGRFKLMKHPTLIPEGPFSCPWDSFNPQIHIHRRVRLMGLGALNRFDPRGKPFAPVVGVKGSPLPDFLLPPQFSEQPG